MPPKPDQTKSIKKVKKQATQEFFNKNRSKSTGGQSFTFNKAPINKDMAKREFIERREQTGNKRSAFTAKLYADDDELDDIKVLAGDQLASDIEEPDVPQKPREAKAKSKQVLGVQQTQVIASRISALVSYCLQEMFILVLYSIYQKGVSDCSPCAKLCPTSTQWSSTLATSKATCP